MEENLLPPGFRFHPTDEEIITHYLTRKVYDISFTSKAIVDVDLNKCEPWDLPAKASMGEKEWYFFNLRDRKYPIGLRTNRATDSGYWKTTGKDKEIFHGDGVLVGMKKTLVFYKGRAPKGVKSNWVMHEYRVQNKYPFKSSQEEWVVCRVFQKRTSAVKKPQQAPPSQPYDDQESPCDTNSIVNEFGDIELPNLNSIANLTTGFDNNVNNNSMNMTNNMNLNMNWTAAAAATIPSLTWPSSLLSPNLSMNSLLLKALQLKNYQAREATSSDQHSFLQQQDGINSQFESDLISSNFQASSSKVLDSVPREQPFNVDSIW